MHSSLRDESGSTLLLQVFLVAAAVLAITVIADVGTAVAARHRLAATADQAAIAGAQAVHLGAYYDQGLASGRVSLDAGEATRAVQRYLAPTVAAGGHAGLSIASVTVTDETVSVQLTSRADLPFSAAFGIESVPVSATATARLQPGG